MLETIILLHLLPSSRARLKVSALRRGIEVEALDFFDFDLDRGLIFLTFWLRLRLRLRRLSLASSLKLPVY